MDKFDSLRKLVLRELGKPYQLGPCGEGPNGRYDQYPIEREDVFDCLTYVNRVLAALNGIGVEQINYFSEEVSYFTRCHYMTSDWLPHNIQADRLSWITKELGFKTKTVTKLFDRGWFFENRSRENLRLLNPLDQTGQDQLLQELRAGGPRGSVLISITYIDWAVLLCNLIKLQASLPPISLMLVVRPGEAFVQSCGMVTHLGFVLNDTDGLYFIHAKHNETVQKEKLLDYLNRFSDSPSVEGASFLAINGFI